jgi:hypothetical protein
MVEGAESGMPCGVDELIQLCRPAEHMVEGVAEAATSPASLQELIMLEDYWGIIEFTLVLA